MKPYKCAICKKEIMPNKQNTEGVVHFDDKYWHQDCFITACHDRIGNKRYRKHNWQDALNNIDKLQENARQQMKLAVDKDELYKFIVSHYDVSYISTAFFTRLNAIYDGSYPRLAYPISPEELLHEWEYYFAQLVEVRKYKNISGEQAIAYDLAILLSKNAEYRSTMEQKKVEKQAKEAQKKAEPDIDWSAIQGGSSASRKNKRFAELYQDFMGGNE